MIHVIPPQTAPDSCVASARWPMPRAGWMWIRQPSVIRLTPVSRPRRCLQRAQCQDSCGRPKQAPIVAENVLLDTGDPAGGDALYDGYGSCPLTVERGHIVLAEFGYGGKLLPSFPSLG